jgi:hypothetical protein
VAQLSQDAVREVAAKRAKWLETIVSELKSGAALEDLRQMAGDMDADLSRLTGALMRQEAEQRQEDWREHQDMLHRILRWAACQKRFDPTFVNRLLQVGKPLSEGQLQAVENIVDKFNIKLENWG